LDFFFLFILLLPASQTPLGPLHCVSAKATAGQHRLSLSPLRPTARRTKPAVPSSVATPPSVRAGESFTIAGEFSLSLLPPPSVLPSLLFSFSDEQTGEDSQESTDRTPSSYWLVQLQRSTAAPSGNGRNRGDGSSSNQQAGELRI
ncbi:hypothetical protein AABB24_032679, partial [Solanum stoloniferum]